MHTKKTTLETYVRKKGYGCISGGNEEAPAESCAPHESTATNTVSLEQAIPNSRALRVSNWGPHQRPQIRS
jgi:hypothetical protein